jgi:hypothetical protein
MSRKPRKPEVLPPVNPGQKSLDDYKRAKPLQLTLFEHLLPGGAGYSNTVELYDFIPKYYWGKAERVGAQFLKTLKRQFECRGKRYKVEIHPARLVGKDGQEREYYPAHREELVEDALRKFVCEGQGIFLDDEAGVTFTLYQLQQELSSTGHTYSNAELKDALLTCAQTKLILTSEDGTAVLISSLFETLGLKTREDWKGKGQKTKAFVRFNPLVTQSIKTLNFRQLDYGRSMKLNSVIARQLHKRMSHHYTQASILNTYHILLSTVIRDFGLTRYKELRNNLRDVVAALDELRAADLIMSYEIRRVTDPKRRNRLVDAEFTVTPAMSFSTDMRQANIRKADIERMAVENRSLGPVNTEV